MAIEQNFTPADGWFVGEDKVLEFEVLQDDGKDIDNPTKAPQDVTGWTLAWALKKSDAAADPALILKKTSPGGGITIAGTFNATRSANAQRVLVTIADTDTDALKAATYRHALKRVMAGADAVLSYGDATLLKATTPAELTP